MCQVNTCCFCNDLERGSFILAIVNIVFGAIQLLSNLAKFTIVGIIASIFVIIINVLLLMGVKQKKPIYVLIWLICTIIFVILNVITAIQALIVLITGNIQGFEPIVTVLIFIIIAALEVYFWIVVYSFYRLLKGGGSTSNV